MKNNKSKLAKIFRPAINLNLPGLRKAATRQVDGRSENGGFTLLLSILVVSVILSVSLGIFDIMTKELKLSGLGRESQIAFYAADAGVECFFYWEIKHPNLDDSAFNAANTINCAGNSVANNFSGNISSFTLPLSNNSCAKVKVTKSGLTTTVESRGYNTACDSTSSFKVERAIQLVSVKKQGGGTYLPPRAPTNFTAIVNADPTNTIELSWTSLASEFYLYKSNDGINYSQIGGTLNTTSYTDNGPFNSATVYYEVVAHNANGDSEATSKTVSTAGILKTSTDTGETASSCWIPKRSDTKTLELTKENVVESSVSFVESRQHNGSYSVRISKDATNWTDITNQFNWAATVNGGFSGGTTNSVDISTISLNGGGTIKGQSKIYLEYTTGASSSIYCSSNLTPTVVTKFK